MSEYSRCLRKKAYATKKEAKKIASFVRKKALEAYCCEFCGMFHIGHKKWRPKSEQ
jgi:hypothetical protein